MSSFTVLTYESELGAQSPPGHRYHGRMIAHPSGAWAGLSLSGDDREEIRKRLLALTASKHDYVLAASGTTDPDVATADTPVVPASEAAADDLIG
jgi:hypothetical protein